jgi:integrase
MESKNDFEIITTESGKQNPAVVYLRSLNSLTSYVVQRNALNIIARKLLGIENPIEYLKGKPGEEPKIRKKRKPGTGIDDAFLFDWATLRYEHTSAIQTWLMSAFDPATAQRMIAAVKGTIKAAWRLKQMTSDDYLRAVDLTRITTESNVGRMLSPEEVAALLATCARGGPTIGTRDAAILMIMVLYTARRAEITTLQYSDYTKEYKSGIDRLVLHGKGRKDRVEFLQNGERDILNDWLKLRGSEPGPLFYVVMKSDEIIKRPIAPITIYQTILRRMLKAGIKNATPHDLRRTAISNLLDITDAVTVAKMAGHSSTATTQKYDKRGEERMITALAKLHLPFRSSDRKIEAL